MGALVFSNHTYKMQEGKGHISDHSSRNTPNRSSVQVPTRVWWGNSHSIEEDFSYFFCCVRCFTGTVTLSINDSTNKVKKDATIRYSAVAMRNVITKISVLTW